MVVHQLSSLSLIWFVWYAMILPIACGLYSQQPYLAYLEHLIYLMCQHQLLNSYWVQQLVVILLLDKVMFSPVQVTGPLIFHPIWPKSLSTVYVAAPVVPQVVTYANELDTLNLTCSNVMTVSSLAIRIFGQTWLDAHGNVVSNAASYSVPLVNRTAAGNYTCVTRLIPNANGVISVTASTLVVVYCKFILCLVASFSSYVLFLYQTLQK